MNDLTRQVILDIETTGMNATPPHYEGHKIIEIGAVEIINRHLTNNNFHTYVKPDRLIDIEAFNIHGISDEFLLDKPTFPQVANDFFNYINGAELVIHNAPFDISFIDYEFSRLNIDFPKISTFCKITDSLSLARKIFPSKRNSLDALCSRYKINSKRISHGALIDAKILAEVYLAMTGGQGSIEFSSENITNKQKSDIKSVQHIIRYKNNKFRVILASNEELLAHKSVLDLIKKNNGHCLWCI